MTSKLADQSTRRVVTFAVPTAGFLWALIELVNLKGDEAVDRYPWWALLVASIVLAIVLLVLELVGSHGPQPRGQYGWIALLIGADGRLSTSKTQAVLWTIVLSTVIVFLGGIVAFGPGTGADLFDKTKWEQYLVLLGGPFAAGILAKFITVSKLESGSLASTLTPAASRNAIGGKVSQEGAQPAAGSSEPTPMPNAADVVANNDGEIDIPDTQYLIFNIVAVVYFLLVYVAQIFDTNVGVERFVLPDMPSVLLGLTGASAAAYIGYKTAQRDGPKVQSMLPQPATAGSAVSVVGSNLIPVGETPGSAVATTSVLLKSLATGGASTVVGIVSTPAPTRSSLTFTMPVQFDGEWVEVRVVTAGSVATAPYRVPVGNAGAAPS